MIAMFLVLVVEEIEIAPLFSRLLLYQHCIEYIQDFGVKIH